MSDEENAALLARIAELEAQLAEATINETVDAKAADQVARTGGSRATKGTAKTIDASKASVFLTRFFPVDQPMAPWHRYSVLVLVRHSYTLGWKELPSTCVHTPVCMCVFLCVLCTCVRACVRATYR